MDKLIYKFNGGKGAILCNNCGKIIYSGKEIPNYLPEGPQFCCDSCKKEYNKKKLELENTEFDYGHNIKYNLKEEEQ